MTLEHEPTVCHKVCQVPYAQPTAPSCVVWSWALIKGCFAPVLVVKGRLHKALGPISARQLCYMCMPMRPNKADETVVLRRWEYCKIIKIIKAETAVQLGSCLGDMTVRMPDRGLVFERVTCFYCSKRVPSLVDCLSNVCHFP